MKKNPKWTILVAHLANLTGLTDLAMWSFSSRLFKILKNEKKENCSPLPSHPRTSHLKCEKLKFILKCQSFNLFLNIKFQFAFRQSELHAFSYWIFSPLAVSSFAGKICKKVFRGQYDKTFFTLATWVMTWSKILMFKLITLSTWVRCHMGHENWHLLL